MNTSILSLLMIYFSTTDCLSGDIPLHSCETIGSSTQSYTPRILHT